jgi:ribosomal protein S18 acetylase RimI-like enzyme
MLLRSAIPEDALGIARVEVATWRAAYQGILPALFLRRLSIREQGSMWRGILRRRVGLVVVFEDYLSGRIVGFSSVGPERDRNPLFHGEIYTLYIDPEFQRRGLGTRLFVAAVSRLGCQGVSSVLVRALAKNPARRLYESLGGRWLSERTIKVGGAPFGEVSYGWYDTSALCALAEPSSAPDL